MIGRPARSANQSGENIERPATNVDRADIVAMNDLPIECPLTGEEPREGAFQ